MKKILIIIKDIFGNSPRSIRCNKIINRISDEFDIHILTLSDQDDCYKRYSNFLVHYIKRSRIGKLINPKGIIGNKNKYKNEKHKKSLYLVKRIIAKIGLKNIFFPDRFIFEYFRIRRRIQDLLSGNNNYDFIIIYVNPITFLMFVGLISKLNKKCIVDLGDPPTNNMAIKQSSLKKKIIDYYEKRLFRHIHALIVTNETTRNYYLSKYKNYTFSKNIHVIPQGAEIYDHDVNSFRKSNCPLRLIYAGQFYKGLRDPMFLFKAVKDLNNIDLHLDIYGAISLKYFNDDILSNKTNIKYKGKISHDNLVKEYAKSDILVYLDNAFGIQQSGKIFELIAIKKPILFIYSNDKSESFRILNDYKAIEYSRNDTMAIKSAIKKMYKNYDGYNYDYDYNLITWDTRAKEYKILLKNI